MFLFISTKPSFLSSKGKSTALPSYIVNIKEKFEQGLMASFLDNWNEAYYKARKMWGFNDDLTRRKAISNIKKNQAFDPNNEQKESKSILFITQYKASLLELCSQYRNDPFAQEILTSLNFSLTPKEQKSIDYVANLSNKFLGDGESPLENALIRLDTEYWLKKIALTSALARGQFNPTDFRDNMIALELEKMRLMETACENTPYPDTSIASHVITTSILAPQLQALQWANVAILKQAKHAHEHQETPFEQELSALVQNSL